MLGFCRQRHSRQGPSSDLGLLRVFRRLPRASAAFKDTAARTYTARAAPNGRYRRLARIPINSATSPNKLGRFSV